MTNYDEIFQVYLAVKYFEYRRPDRRQAIGWTNAGILLIWSLGTNFREMLIEIQIFSFKKMYLKMSSAILSRPQCVKESLHLSATLGLNGYIFI